MALPASNSLIRGEVNCHRNPTVTPVTPATPVETVHDAVDALERSVREGFPEARRVVGHAEPAGP
jgi:hypothetical protein